MVSEGYRIGVLSDTHGDLLSIESALTRLGSLDALVHAGDYYRDGERLALKLPIPVIAVVGNCDARRHPLEEIVELAGKKFFVTHGHLYGVKNGTQNLVREARRRRADVVVFGHTHVPVLFSELGMVFVNPGSTHSGRRGAAPACSLIIITGTQVDVAHFSL